MITKVLVTAVAGTGKSTTCKALQDLGYHALDIESVDGLFELVDEKTGQVIPGSLDQIREGIEWNCNKKKLKDVIEANSAKLTFYCGGMANTEEIWNLFDTVMILTVSDKTTVKRLSTRKNGEFGSTQENREWVLSWKHEIEQKWISAGGIMVSAEEAPSDVARNMVTKIQYLM